MINLIDRVNPTIRAAAMAAAPDKTQRATREAQSAWDAGISFISTGNMLADMFPSQRGNDGEDEIAAAVQVLQQALANIATDGAIRGMRREAVAGLAALAECDPTAAVILYGNRITASDLLSRWNEQHPGREIRTAPAFEI